MLYINNPYTDAWFNLAAEEYLLKNFSDDIFMLWQNEPSVIIGKHQNVWDEINRNYIQEKHIKVVRRYSGGGAVYHDSGNLNITFIQNSKELASGTFTARQRLTNGRHSRSTGGKYRAVRNPSTKEGSCTTPPSFSPPTCIA